MRIRILMLCLVVGVATSLTACRPPVQHASGAPVSAPRVGGPVQRLSQPEQKAVAGPVEPDRRIGAIFIDGGPLHVCTGSVVHSTGGNLIMTAAHCLAGASLITFVPGFAGDAAPGPADVWKADAVYLDPRWMASKDPHADYAIARVSNEAGAPVESRVGLALTLGVTPRPAVASPCWAIRRAWVARPSGARPARPSPTPGSPHWPARGWWTGPAARRGSAAPR